MDQPRPSDAECADDPIARLAAAFEARGVAVRPPPDASAVAAVQELVSPLRLPPLLVDLWSRIQVASLPVGVRSDADWLMPFDPLFCDPAVSHAVWSNMLERPGVLPEALIPISVAAPWRGGARLRLAALDAPNRAGTGAVYEWTLGTTEVVQQAGRLDGWLDAVADGVVAEGSDIDRTGQYVGFAVPEHDLDRLPGDRRRRPIPRTDWPHEWRETSTLFEERRPRREMTSVASLRWSRPRAATVAGETIEIASNADGTRVQVMDGSGVLDAWCPSDAISSWLLRRFNRNELQVTTDVSSWTPGEYDSPFWTDVLRTPPDVVVEQVRCRVVA